jgi:Cof subfamily protein (haloacid dehalogenase superfamily)
MYKALITDLDGTAIAISSNGDDIDNATKEAIQRAIAIGKRLTCATGRDWEGTKAVVHKLGFVAPCIIEGGTRIIDPLTEKTLWEKALKPGASTKILKVFKAQSKTGVVMSSADTHGSPIASVQSVPKNLSFLYLLAVPEPTAIKISNYINAEGYAISHNTPSWSGNGLIDVHVTHTEATKEHAIQVWQQLEGIKHDETIGVGDSGNDVPIFQSSGLKIAVGNATPGLKSLADYIAPAFNEHALMHVINKFLLNK